MEWLYLIAIGLICVAFPIILFLYIWYLPPVIIVLFFLWIVFSLATIVLSKSKKWYEELIGTFVLTGIFTIVLGSAISNSSNYMFDEDNTGIIIAPAISIVAIYFVGSFLKEKRSKSLLVKQAKQKEEIRKDILQIEKEIVQIENKIEKKEKAFHLVELLAFCGSDINEINEHPENKATYMLMKDIQERKEIIKELKEKL